MWQRVPMEAIPNHKFSAVLTLGQENRKVTIHLTYNELAQYWVVDLSTDDSDLISGMPMVPAQDILEQFKYLGLGSMYLIPTSETAEEWPSQGTLETGWAVLWGD
jgi:hypothetical protein